jgi:hypothetical protein
MKALLVLLAACGGHVHHATPLEATSDITLYRDIALVRQRVDITVPATPTTIRVKVAAGAADLIVVDRGGVELRSMHVIDAKVEEIVGEPGMLECGEEVTADCAPPPDPEATPAPEADDDTARPAAPPIDVDLDVAAPHAGTYSVVLTYTTDRLQWDADYTMTTTPARDHAVLRGAIAVRNTTAIAFDHASLHVIDAGLVAWRARTAEYMATTMVGGTPSTTPAATPRDLGIASLVDGETRVEITGISKPRAMNAVLVYDPIGTKLDNPAAAPVRDFNLGIAPVPPSRITESFEVQRDERGTAGLPAGPVRLLERRRDGGLGVLGESRLFDAATRVANVDTIAVGTAEGVTGHRERRELTIDDVRQRLTEEFVITLDNARDHDVGVLVREHLYRSQTWNVSYESTKRPSKEGAQQFSMRSTVPAKSQQKILYVVVYTWEK